MTDTRPRIVFLGTPEFAVASLAALHERGYDIAAVVTAPDRPAGRGRKLTASPVKQFALANHLPLLQPERLRDPGFLSALTALRADLFIIVAFRMLPEVVWQIPAMGTFNLHASLLPQYRGAAPINHAIINGEEETGVTTFFINHEIDSGMILMSRKTAIAPDENAGKLHDRLMEMGAALVIETTEGIWEGRLTPRPQDIPEGEPLKPAPRIFPADTVIDWRRTATAVHNLVRGLSPHPGAAAMLTSGDRTMRLKVIATRLRPDLPAARPGTMTTGGEGELTVACDQGVVEIISLIPEGRKLMSSREFLRGFDPTGWSLAWSDRPGR